MLVDAYRPKGDQYGEFCAAQMSKFDYHLRSTRRGAEHESVLAIESGSPYKMTEKPSRYWIKVKNSQYSQLEGREELFERV